MNRRALAVLALSGLATIALYETAPGTLWPAGPRIVAAVAIVGLASGRTAAASALYAVADGLLAVASAWPRAFLVAMGLFLAGHLTLASALGRGPRSRALVTALPLAIHAAGVVAFVNAGLGALRIPVIVYVASLTFMAWRACLAAQDRARPPSERVSLVAGALLFFVADTLLAIDKFHHSIPHEKALAMIPYWASLVCFARASSLRAGT